LSLVCQEPDCKVVARRVAASGARDALGTAGLYFLYGHPTGLFTSTIPAISGSDTPDRTAALRYFAW
jgi:hypothetical protein